MSGGEKYILTAANCLAYKNNTTIFWDETNISDIARKKLHIDLAKISIKKNIFSPKVSLISRLSETRKYDRIIVLCDGSIPITLARKTYLHFQFPVEWVNGDNLITKIKLLKINGVFCNSMFTKKYIDKKFGIKSLILYHPCVSADVIEKNSKQIMTNKKNIILTVGRYSPLPEGGSTKKIELMIRVFQEMVDNGLSSWQFVIAVSFLKENERYIYNLESQIKNYPIKIIKNSDYKELKKIYCDAKIYWHAAGFGEDLDKHPERAEHFGITTVEAMAHNIVPIVFSKGGLAEIVEDNINGFLWYTEKELMRKTQKIIIDIPLRRQMANLGLKKANNFTIEKFCDELQKIII